MKKLLLILLCVPLIFSCGVKKEKKKEKNNTNIIAKKIPKINIYHTDTTTDNYDWMRLSDSQKESHNSDAQTLDVLNYLNAENNYLEKAMTGTESFQNDLCFLVAPFNNFTTSNFRQYLFEINSWKGRPINMVCTCSDA